MLSGAKHLQFSLDNQRMQILRFAQDNSRGHSFRSLLVGKLSPRCAPPSDRSTKPCHPNQRLVVHRHHRP